MTGTALDATPFGFLLPLLGWLYWGLMLIGIGVALWWPKWWWVKVPLAIAIAVVFIRPVHREASKESIEAAAFAAKKKEAMDLFHERCKSANEQILKTVEGVDSIFLLKLRPTATSLSRHKPTWAGAALHRELQDEWYIKSFLYWEHRDSQYANKPGYVNDEPSTRPGYKYVYAKDTFDKLIRYSAIPNSNGKLKSEIAEWSDAPRFGIDFDDDITPSDRSHWVAGTTVSIVDVKIDQVIATKSWYSIDLMLGQPLSGSAPWSYVKTCPDLESGHGISTRLFALRVLNN